MWGPKQEQGKESQNYFHLPDMLLLTAHFVPGSFLVPSNLARRLPSEVLAMSAIRIRHVFC